MINKYIQDSLDHLNKLLLARKSGGTASVNLLDELEASHNLGVISREPTRTILEGSDQPWAVAASIRPKGKGAANLKACVKLTDGSMSIGILSKDEKKFLSDLPMPVTKDFVR